LSLDDLTFFKYYNFIKIFNLYFIIFHFIIHYIILYQKTQIISLLIIIFKSIMNINYHQDLLINNKAYIKIFIKINQKLNILYILYKNNQF
jgi:hypothetical protein